MESAKKISHSFESKLVLYLWWYIWLLSLWAVLQIHRLPFFSNQSVCGLWGCGPPISSLLSCHLAWILILLPGLLMVKANLSARSTHFISWLMIVGSCLIIAGVVIYQAVTWLPNVDVAIRQYFSQRCGFVIITATDYPILQLMIAGGFLRLWPSGFLRKDRNIALQDPDCELTVS